MNRGIENGLAILGGLLAAIYVIGVEVLPHVIHAIRPGAPAPAGNEFPWGVALVVFALVLPKTVGRATAGRVWDAVSARFGGGKSRDDAAAG